MHLCSKPMISMVKKLPIHPAPYGWFQGISKPPIKSHLARTKISFQKCRHCLNQLHELPLQGGTRTFSFPDNGRMVERSGWKTDLDKENDPDVNKKRNRNVYFCILYSHYFSTSIQRVINSKKTFNLYWIRVKMSYHIPNNLFKLLNVDLAAKSGRVILSCDLMDR